MSGLVGAALGQFQYTWLVKKKMIVAQTNVVLDLAGAARESGLFMYCFLLLISLVVAASILVPPEEDPRGVPSQAGKGIQGHLLQQDQLSWRRDISSSSLETLPGLWRLSYLMCHQCWTGF